MNKHTPGPWRIDQEFLPAARVDVGPEDGVNIFEVCCSGYIAGANAEEELGNAWLIVAAPEMADLLREIAQLPQLLDGIDRSAVVITSDLRQRIGEVLLRLNGHDEWPY